MNAAEPKRRWFQFSLRTLLIAVAVVAGLAFGWMKAVGPYRLQRQAMQVITKLGGTYKTEDATGWVARYLDKNAQDVVVIDLADCDKPDEYLPHLVRLPRLRTLVVGGHRFGNEQVAILGRVGTLKGLVLDSTLVSDECLGALKEGSSDLVVCQSQRRACAELKKVGGMFGYRASEDKPHPTHVAVPGWLRTEAADVYFAKSPSVVRVAGDRGADLAWLGNLLDVRAMYLSGRKITDSIPHLEKLTQLEHLMFDDRTDISPEGIKRLQHALPHCFIHH